MGDLRPDTTDAEWIRRSISRPDDFRVVFDRHFDWIHAFMLRRTDPESALEISSETFLTGFEKRAKFDPSRPSARPWLIGIALNKLRRRHRTWRRESEALLKVSAGHPGAGDAGSGGIEAFDGSSELMVAVSRLKPKDRIVLLLIAWEDLSYAEVAEALELPIGTVRSRLNRARKQIAGHMEAAEWAASKSVDEGVEQWT